MGGSGTYTYSWLSSTTSGTTGFATASGTNTTQNYSPPALSVTTWYRRKITSGSCVDTSAAIAISVNANLANNVINASQNICSGSVPAPLTGGTPVGGTGIFTYTWLSSGTSATNGFTAAAGTNNTINYSPAALSANTWFRRLVVSGADRDTSIAVFIRVDTAVTNNTISGTQSICLGRTPATLNGSIPLKGNGTSYTYRWLKSTTSDSTGFTLAGMNDSTQQYHPLALAATTWYKRTVRSGACAVDTTAAIRIAVSSPITINTASGSQTICSGSSAGQLSGNTPAGGNGTFQYRWLSSTVDSLTGFAASSGQNDSQNYTPAVLTTSTWFRRLVTSGGCTDTSVATFIAVTSPIVLNNASGAQAICAGSTPDSISGSIPVGGNGSFTYRWLRSTAGATSGYTVAGGNDSTQHYHPAALSASTWFARYVSSGGCADTSTAVAVSLNSSIANNTTSGSQSICTGSTASQITGGIPSGGSTTYAYTWLSSTTGAITGFSPAAGTNSAISYVPGTLATTTWFRRLTVSGNCSDTSAAAKISINPVIATNTVSGSQIVCSGTPPALITGSLPTGGDTTLYQFRWLRSVTDALNGFSNTGGNDSAQSYQPDTLTSPTWFRRYVVSGGCADTSAAVSISLNSIITSNTISGTQSVCGGMTPSMLSGSTAAGGNGTTYQYVWLKSIVSDSTGFVRAGGNDSTLNFQPLATTGNTWYRRAVSSGVCAVDTSEAVAVSVSAGVTPNTVSGTQTRCFGTASSILSGSLPTGGTGAFAYAWISSTTSDSTGFSLAPGVNNTRNYTPATLTSSAWFRRVVASGACADTSAAVKVTITPAIANDTLSSSQSVCTGSVPATITGSLPSGGSGAFTYSWFSSTLNGNDSFTTASGTNNTQHYSPATLGTTTWFRRVVASGGCSDTSVATQISISPAVNPSVLISASSTSICGVSFITFTATASNAGNSPSFEWRVNDSIRGTNASTFILASPALGDSIYVRITATSSLPCATDSTAKSAGIKLTNTNVTPTVSISTPDSVICKGTNVLFTAVGNNTGLTPHYQWLVNNLNAGQDMPTFDTSGLSNKDTVQVIMTSSAGCLTNPTAPSNKIIMRVGAIPLITLQPLNDSTISGRTATFKVKVSGPVTYRWQQSINGGNTFTDITNGATFSGVSTDSLTVKNTFGLHQSRYRAYINGQCGNVYSDTAMLVINFRPIALNDSAKIAMNDSVNVVVMVNDTDYDGTLGPPSIILAPKHGTAAVLGNGSISYKPALNYYGPDTVKYRVCDNGRPTACDSAFLFIRMNARPIVVNDTIRGNRDSVLTFEVRTNDRDPDGTLNKPTIIAMPLHGTASVNTNGTIVYTPVAGYTGKDTLRYKVCDNGSPVLCDSAFVFIRIDSLNRAPVAGDTTYAIFNSSVLNGKVVTLVTDPDNNIDTLSYVLVSAPSSGSVTVQPNGTFTYTPLSTFTGTTSFVYRVYDLGIPVYNDTGIISIVIAAGNKRPVARNDSFVVEQNSEINFAVRTNDIDSDGVLGNPAILFSPAHGTVVVNSNGMINYKPATDFNGIDIFTYKVCDNGTPSLCDSARVKITVTPLEDNRILVPEGFSPNGDGINDIFFVKNIHLIPNNKLTVFNRWGSVVYEAGPYLNDWGGKSKPGFLTGDEILPAGTYYYLFELGNGEPAKTGYFYINK